MGLVLVALQVSGDLVLEGLEGAVHDHVVHEEVVGRLGHERVGDHVGVELYEVAEADEHLETVGAAHAHELQMLQNYLPNHVQPRNTHHVLSSDLHQVAAPTPELNLVSLVLRSPGRSLPLSLHSARRALSMDPKLMAAQFIGLEIFVIQIEVRQVIIFVDVLR